MKKVFLIITILFGFLFLTAFKSNFSNLAPTKDFKYSDEYCEGWEDGYCEGWKDVKDPYSICPITPLCPLSEIFKDTYKDGYNRGFKAGTKAANK